MSGGMVSFDEVSLGYDRGPVLRQITGAIETGDLLALVGPNGAGKSTLLKAIMGEIAPSAGRIDRGGRKPGEIAYLPQRSEIDPSFPISVFDCVALGLWRETGAFGGFSRDARARVMAAIETVGLAAEAGCRIGALSGGQLQRALFARLMLQDAPLILLDEPFAAIDAQTVKTLMGLIRAWHAEGRTVVAALHDPAQVRKSFPKTLLLDGSVIAWGLTEKALGKANLLRAGLGGGDWTAPAGGHRGVALQEIGA